MEGSNTQVGIMKPLIVIKAGIPLAITVAGFAFARIIARKSHFSTALLPKNRANSQEDGSSDVYRDEGSDQDLGSDIYNRTTTESTIVDQTFELKEEILRLRSRIKDIQDRELKLETRFLHYQELKNQETTLMELHYKFLLEMEKVEVWGREILMLEAENQRFEKMVVEYVKVLGQLSFSRSKNEKLHKRIKKLVGRNAQQFHILRKQCLQIEAKDAEISKNQRELEVKADCIRKMEDEIRVMKLFAEHLQGEKNELLDNLRVAENSATSKENGEMVNVEDYNQLRLKLEQLEKDKAAEVQESIYLRRSNAWLRNELMHRNQEQTEENKQIGTGVEGVADVEEFGSDNELSISINHEQDDSRLDFPSCGLARVRTHSKRRRLITKFKRWVEGTEKNSHGLDEKEKHGNHWFRRHSISDEAEEVYLPGRKSCSSA